MDIKVEERYDFSKDNEILEIIEDAVQELITE